MITLVPIKVECYSGFTADEYPRCFYLGKGRYEIEEIADRWYQGDSNQQGPVSNYFKVVIAGGIQYLLKHELLSDTWFLCQSEMKS